MAITKSPLLPQTISARQHEITADFMRIIDSHMEDILAGRTMEMYEIRDVAAIMHIHPTHLSNTVKLTTGRSTCLYFEDQIMTAAKDMLAQNTVSIAEIARKLTFDPSNFTKFFKKFAGITPKQYREQILTGTYQTKSETVTI